MFISGKRVVSSPRCNWQTAIWIQTDFFLGYWYVFKIKVEFWCVSVEYACVHAKLLESTCLTLCDPMDRRPPGSSVHVILKMRILEWDAMAFSKGSFRPMSPALVGEFSCISCIGRRDLHHSCNLGSPQYIYSPNHHKVHLPSFSYTSLNPHIYMSVVIVDI